MSVVASSRSKKGILIALLCIHVERTIGRIKIFLILKLSYPLSMICLAYQIVCVCACLSNFQPILVPPPHELSDTEGDNYFQERIESDLVPILTVTVRCPGYLDRTTFLL